MSNRSRPRASRSPVSGTGSRSLFGSSRAIASAAPPRGTVPATGSRAHFPSAKSALGASGSQRGCSDIVWWQATATAATTSARVGSARNFGDLRGAEPAQQLGRRPPVEARVARVDGEEEAILGRAREARDVEERVVRHREAVQREHPEEGGEPPEEHG